MFNFDNIEQALLITVIGVTLIFVVLLVMWGFMALLVRLAAPQPEPTKAQAASAASVNEDVTVMTRRRAAVVAVAVALAIEAKRAHSAPLLQSAPGPISPWQATLRGNALSRRAGAFRRNPPAR